MARYQTLLHDYILQSKGTKKYIPPPFVVCVCQQTLARQCRSHDIAVHVVPGEADDYCVRLARETKNAYMVSADSDFLVFSGEAGNFVSLQTFPWQWDNTIQFAEYNGLREKLGLTRPNGMMELAALLNEKTQLSVSECIKCINSNRTLNYLSKETLHEYVTMYTATDGIVASDATAKFMASRPFGRMTELLFAAEMPTFWLPMFPVTNPPRKTPWVISRSIRQAAYSALRKRGLVQGDTVIEMVQRGQRVTADRVSIEATEVVWTQRDAEEMFIVAMHILLENVPDEELQYLAYFAGMYALLQQPTVELSYSVVPPRCQYVALQYQSIIYSLIILLQAQFPYSDIPDFASLWDLPRFKTAISAPVPAGKDIWMQITSTMDPQIQNLWNPQDPLNKKPKKTSPPTPKTESNDSGNPFSLLYCPPTPPAD
jgi:predicted nucleic acid-binding protein